MERFLNMSHTIKAVLASLLFAALLGLGALGLAVWGPDGAVTGPFVNAGTVAQKLAAGQSAGPANTSQNVTGQQTGNGPTVSDGTIPVPYLGLEYLTITPEVAAYYGLAQQNGVYVESVVPNSPAAKAGIQAGSIIIKFDGVSLDGTKDLLQLLLDCKPGDTVPLSLIAKNSNTEKQISVVLGTRPTNP
jgi:S1-C subfamily serine protease